MCSKTVYLKMQGRKEEAKVKEGKGRLGTREREVQTEREWRMTVMHAGKKGNVALAVL